MDLTRFKKALAVSLLGFFITSTTHAQSTDLLDKVKQTGTLRVGVEGTYPPFNFYDPSGKLQGFEIDFSNELGKELGIKIEFQPGKWDGLLGALESQRIDAVINQVTITDARKKVYDFTTPYTISGIQPLVRAKSNLPINSVNDLTGKRVGVGLGTNYEKWLTDNAPGAIVKTYDDDPTKFQDLQVGRTDVILIDRLAALEMIKKTNNALALGGPAFSRQEAAIAIRKGNPKLLEALNQAIQKMQTDGRLKAISNKWFETDVSQ